MPKCKKCGAALRDGAKFCSKCGAAVEDIFCSACGTKLETGDNFCYLCGEAVCEAAAVPAAVKSENEYPAWQSFAAQWDVMSMLSVGAGSPEGHYLSNEYGNELFRVSADGVQAEPIALPEGVLSFYGKQWKSGRLWLSALMSCDENTSRLHRIYNYTPEAGFSVLLDVSGEEYGDLEIVRFIATETHLFIYGYNPRRKADHVSLMVCDHEGNGLHELWKGKDFVMHGAGLDKLYMIGEDSRGTRSVAVIPARGEAVSAAGFLGAQLDKLAAAMGLPLGTDTGEREDFCWKYIPFIDFAEGVVYGALDEGGTENLTRRLWSIGIKDGEAEPYGERWQLGDIDPTENFREYFDGSRAVGFSYEPGSSWTALHADGSRVNLGAGNYWDGGTVLGDYFYLDCRGSEPGTWYKISLKDGSKRKIEK